MMIIPSLSRLFTSAQKPKPSTVDAWSLLTALAIDGLITLYPHRGDDVLASIPDLDGAIDWVVLPRCGHLSRTLFTRTEAEQWHCPVCDEQRSQARNISDLTERLRFLASHTPKATASLSLSQRQLGC